MNYNILESAWNYRTRVLEVSTIGVIIDGITDFQTFLIQFKSALNYKKKIVKLTETSIFLLINTSVKDFWQYKRLFEDSHYTVYSIFLNDFYFSEYFDQNDETIFFNENLFYLFIQTDKTAPIFPNSTYNKISTTEIPRYVYKFRSYSELLDTYTTLIEQRSHWPLFCLTNQINDQIYEQKNSIEIINNNLTISDTSTHKFYPFTPDKNLYYFSFIEDNFKKCQRLRNVDRMYSISEINDVQIGCLYKNSIRTFLGFESEFRCLHAFDFFLYLEKEFKSVADVGLFQKEKKFNFKVNFDFFYIEMPTFSIENEKDSFFDNSIIFSICYNDVFKFRSSTFFGFADQIDFQSSLKFLKNNLEKNQLSLCDVKKIDSSELEEKFDHGLAERMVKSKFSFIVIALKKGDFKTLTFYLKEAKIIEHNVECKMSNGQKIVLAGFENDDVRERVFESLNKFQVKIQCFFPENLIISNELDNLDSNEDENLNLQVKKEEESQKQKQAKSKAKKDVENQKKQAAKNTVKKDDENIKQQGEKSNAIKDDDNQMQQAKSDERKEEGIFSEQFITSSQRKEENPDAFPSVLFADTGDQMSQIVDQSWMFHSETVSQPMQTSEINSQTNHVQQQVEQFKPLTEMNRQSQQPNKQNVTKMEPNKQTIEPSKQKVDQTKQNEQNKPKSQTEMNKQGQQPKNSTEAKSPAKQANQNDRKQTVDQTKQNQQAKANDQTKQVQQNKQSDQTKQTQQNKSKEQNKQKIDQNKQNQQQKQTADQTKQKQQPKPKEQPKSPVDQNKQKEQSKSPADQKKQKEQPKSHVDQNKQKEQSKSSVDQSKPNQQSKANEQNSSANQSNQTDKPSPTTTPQKNATPIKPKKPLGPDYFSPNQSLIYFYFIEKEKARKISSGKQVKLTLFGVKKCKDIQRYKKIPESSDGGYYTFFGFDKYDEAETAINLIKSKWLSESTVQIYESTTAYVKYKENPSDDDEESREFLLQAINEKKQNMQTQPKTEKVYTIKNVRINIYRDINTQNFQFFQISQLSIPINIQYEIKMTLNKVKTVKNIIRDVVPHDLIYQPCTFVFVDIKDQMNENIFRNVFSKYKIGYTDIPPQMLHGKINYLEFEELYFPGEKLQSFLHFLSLVHEIKEIRRNIFHKGLIVTILFFDSSKEDYILDLIESFLIEEEILFDTKKYSPKSTILFKEDVMLQKKDDFDLIVKEIVSFGIKPIYIERNKLLFNRSLVDNQCFHRFSFICFNNKEEKMKSLNHINEILFTGKENFVKYNPDLYYIKCDPWRYPLRDYPFNCSYIFKIFTRILNNVADYQENVVSIEHPIELTYIGFKSKKLMYFYNSLLFSRVIYANVFDDSVFFRPDENMFYIKFNFVNKEDKLENFFGDDVLSKIAQGQLDCIDFPDSGAVKFSYIGFNSDEDRQFVLDKMKAFDNENHDKLVFEPFELQSEFDDLDELTSENILTTAFYHMPFHL